MLACRAVASAMVGAADTQTREFMDAAVEFLVARYDDAAPSPYELVTWALEEIRIHKPDRLRSAIRGATRLSASSEEARRSLTQQLLAETSYRDTLDALLPTALNDISESLNDLTTNLLTIDGGTNV